MKRLSTAVYLENLERKCADCDGKGRRKAANPGIFSTLFANGEEKCPICDGNGATLTPEGQKFAEFIMRHITTGIDGGGLRYR